MGAAVVMAVSLGFVSALGRTATRPSSIPSKTSKKIIPIRIAPGEMSVHVKGRFTSQNHERWYRMEAKAGQRMIVNLISKSRGMATAGVVRSPSGQQDGQPGGVIYDHILKESGTYTLRAFPHSMASKLIGDYVVEVIILPSYVARP
jgi:hypothetical protein